MKHAIFICYLIYATSASAQATKPAAPPQQTPVTVKRVPASAKPTTNPTDDTLRKQVNADLNALQQPISGPASAVRPTNPAAAATVDFLTKADMPLTPTAEAAVRLSEEWLTESNAPAPGADGRVVYSYGAGLPTVVCAPLRVCIVELQAGERLVGEPHIGDSVRWNIDPASFGKGDSATTIIVIKPQDSGLDTNLLLTTDRRAYYLRLVSKPVDYIARVAFAYPEDDLATQRWKDQLAKQQDEQHEANRISELPAGGVESMNFNYTIKGGAPEIRPLQVFDDGEKTYIRMNPDVPHQEAPVLVVIGPDGKSEMLNYRVKGDLYIADRIFERAQLILGVDKKAKKVEIIRGKATKS
jgi:type IV secretion system protein VirB9